MLVARLEFVAALGELLHLPEQADGPREHLGEIKNGVRVEGAAVLCERDLEEAPEAARENDIQVAPEPAHRLLDGRRHGFDGVAVPPPGRLGHAVLLLELRLAEPLGLARLAVLREEVRTDSVDEDAKGRLHFLTCVVGQAWRGGRTQQSEVGGQHRKLGMPDRTFGEQLADAPGCVSENIGEAFGRPAAGNLQREIARPEIEKPPEDVGCDEPAAEQRGQPFAQLALAQLHEHHGHVGVGLREMTAGAKRPVQRLADEPGNFRLVSQIETGIDVCFERELADERQAEGVNRRNRDLAEALAQPAPA